MRGLIVETLKTVGFWIPRSTLNHEGLRAEGRLKGSFALRRGFKVQGVGVKGFWVLVGYNFTSLLS